MQSKLRLFVLVVVTLKVLGRTPQPELSGTTLSSDGFNFREGNSGRHLNSKMYPKLPSFSEFLMLHKSPGIKI